MPYQREDGRKRWLQVAVSCCIAGLWHVPACFPQVHNHKECMLPEGAIPRRQSKAAGNLIGTVW